MSWSWLGSDDEDETVEIGDDATSAGSHGSRDGLIFLVDFSKSMFDTLEEATPFQLVMKCAVSTMKNQIIANEKDLFGIVFFGTEKHHNPGNFQNIYIFQNLDMLDGQRVLEVEELYEDIEHSTGKFGHSSGFSLNDVFWICSDMFSLSPQKISTKRILLFTNNDDPHKDYPSLQRQAKTKAKDLFNVGIDIELIPIKPSVGEFDANLFYEDIVAEIDEDEKATMPDPAEKFEELLMRTRTKQYRKRPVARLPWNLGEGISLGVSVYSLCRTAVKSSHVNIDSRSNEEVKTVSKLICETTGVELLPSDLKYYQMFGGKKIVFEKEEVDAMKSFENRGLTLLGFKKRSLLKHYHHIRPSLFIYPDEKSVTGSNCLFTALLKKCSAKDLVAICRFVQRQAASVRLCALLPQEEEKNEKNLQITPPGFHLIYLPFAEDLRKLTYKEFPRVKDEQVEKAKEIVKALTVNFDPMAIENPSLQKHYRSLEALALDKETAEEFKDCSEPDKTQMDARLGNLATEFKDLVFPDGYNPDGNTSKTKATSASSSSAKRAKNEEAVDVKELARTGKLQKLTVPVLKDFVKCNNIKCRGSKKCDLVEAVNDHFSNMSETDGVFRLVRSTTASAAFVEISLIKSLKTKVRIIFYRKGNLIFEKSKKNV
ncbi:X-ray repair cross-complementing protein 6-like [Xenia sp. Carnegie-2017]|uniref:X-ray repair cross-complementing protein 6-like n=1 Tax=Xenia sp. Carnegie-2017 TaxID=2897299 RepID=UPI001F03456F|nr:X-ray repair cross-complementing protein 6-like [Xenia sp. Carnegie-2017]XP_046862084.1 X-ray repair cross-complementing protein 6-like [Xenia sp. Carnegie-2017]